MYNVDSWELCIQSVIAKYSPSLSYLLECLLLMCTYSVCIYINYLNSSGGVRISPSQSASNVKIRPRQITTKWEGQGPSLTATKYNTHIT